jgi:acyl-CoA synthetase (AMP-forming)/AMP-acid ligase II
MFDYFRKGLSLAPDRPAFISKETTLTHRQADALSLRIASAMQATQSPDDCRAAVLCPNDPIAFACILGIFRCGAAWLPVNVRNPVEVNVALMRTTECSILFFHSSLRDQAQVMREQVSTIRQAVCIDQPDPAGAPSLEQFMERSTGSVMEPPDDPDRVITVFPTGGTTGLSKAAQWTQRVWSTCISGFWTSLHTPEPPVHLVAAPMTHAAGVVALAMMSGGTTNVVLPKADPESMMRAIQEHKVTHMYMPPTLMYMILAHPDVAKYDYSSLKYVVIAAAPVAPQKLQEAMRVFGNVMCQSYGQAEAPMFMTFLSSYDLNSADINATPNRWASCGRSCLNVRVAIMDDDGNLLPPEQKGEIVTQGPLVFGGYYKNPKATSDVSLHGWHHTGDIGYMDAQGFVYIVDRKKDMIITGGFNVYSAEVEQVILSHPAVQECAVIGVPDEKWGEAIKAVVELKAGASATEEQIISTVKAKLGSIQAPKSVEFWPELPRSVNGKLLKRDIRDSFWKGRDRAVS